MTNRLRRCLTEVSSTNQKAGAKDVECEFCTVLRRTRELEVFDPLPRLCSPLTPGVQLANLSYDGKVLRAELGVHSKRMFEQLPLIGDALVMTRNQAVILGRYMTFPELAFTPHGFKGASERGGLWFDFRRLGVARAVHLCSESGHVFGIEFADRGGVWSTALPPHPLAILTLFSAGSGCIRLVRSIAGRSRRVRELTRRPPKMRRTQRATAGCCCRFSLPVVNVG
jgi:hypothetical protein